MKKLITVTWSVSIEAEIPDGMTNEAFLFNCDNIKCPPGFDELQFDIISKAADNIDWKGGVITDITDYDEIQDAADNYLNDKQIKELKEIVSRENESTRS